MEGDRGVVGPRAGTIADPPTGRTRVADPQRLSQVWVEGALAVAAFAALCIATLSVAPQAAEPDDGAYHASIAAMVQGHLLTLSAAQAETLASSLNDNPAAPPNQWVEVAPGRYMSEKDPGYPFLAAPFEKLGLIRWAPLFFGALGCAGLFVGGRRWLGRWGGLASMGLFCSSGAAMGFAWRDYMPTFTDASLVAAGTGLLLWVALATEVSTPKRTWAGLVGFAALETATFVRYTNVVILCSGILVLCLAWRLRAAGLPTSAMRWWLGAAAVFGVGVAAFDTAVYGGPLATGYPTGEVTFALQAMGPNLKLVPGALVQAMPVSLLGLTSLAWILVRRFVTHRDGLLPHAPAVRDLWVGLSLSGSWFAIWTLYSTYTWTTDPTNVTVQVVRFYLPAIGAISLLGAWLVTRIPGRNWIIGLITSTTIAILFALGVMAFHAMYEAFGMPLTS